MSYQKISISFWKRCFVEGYIGDGILLEVLEKYFFLLISLQTGDLQIAVNIEGRVRNYSLEDLTGAPWYRLPLILQSEIWEPLLLLLIVTLVLYILDLPKSDSSKFVVIKGKVGIS